MKEKYKDYIMIESEVLQLLESACSEGEKYEKGKQLKIGNHVIVADAFFQTVATY